MEVTKYMGIWKEKTRLENLEQRISSILADYSFVEVMEMNDLSEEEILMILYMAGHIKEPESYLP
jgi:hypothetical protein